MKSSLPPQIYVPVPTALPAAAKAIDVYWGPAGFTPDYNQAARASLDITSIPTITNDAGVLVYVISTQPAVTAGATGSTDFYFTVGSEVTAPPTTADFEGDFGPVVTINLTPDVSFPMLGQPIGSAERTKMIHQLQSFEKVMAAGVSALQKSPPDLAAAVAALSDGDARCWMIIKQLKQGTGT